jgi:hypothetical protein
LVTCFDTKKDEIDEFINDFRAILVVKQWCLVYSTKVLFAII